MCFLIYSETSEVLWPVSHLWSKQTVTPIVLCVWLSMGQMNKWNYTNPVVAVDLFPTGAALSRVVPGGENCNSEKLILTLKSFLIRRWWRLCEFLPLGPHVGCSRRLDSTARSDCWLSVFHVLLLLSLSKHWPFLEVSRQTLILPCNLVRILAMCSVQDPLCWSVVGTTATWWLMGR